MKCVLSSAALLFAALCSSMPAAEMARATLDAGHSIVLEQRTDEIRLFVASERTGRELMLLDSFPARSIAAAPTLEVIGTRSAYLHFYGDYGFYYGSRKYLFDATTSNPPVKIPYGIVSLRSTSRQGEKLNYQGLFAEGGNVQDPVRARFADISIEPRADAFPRYQVTAVGPPIESSQLAIDTPMRGPAGESIVVEHDTPPGQPHHTSVILVNQKPFPAPIPTLDFYRRTLPQRQPPGEIESDIGPFVQAGNKIWFATTFYDGEGTSGIGAIGSFDISARKYDMRYLPEIAPWSGSAMLLAGNDLWIGLKRRPEGADIGGGMLRYNIHTGEVKTFAIPDVIFTIDRAGDAVYCGTSHGLYMIRGARVTQFRFEPGETGQLVMIPRDVPQAVAARPSAR